MRLGPAAAAVLVLTGCSDGGSERRSDEPTSLPSGLVQESDGVVYGLAGTDSLIPVTAPGVTEFTLGISIMNRSDETVTIESFEVAEAVGLEVAPELVVGTPRALNMLASEARWPPIRQWDPSVERPYGAPLELPPGDDSADFGALVLLHVVLDEPLGHVKGYRVRGTQGGEPFEDFVDTFTALCVGPDLPVADCYDYANEHAFSPLGDPPDLSSTVTTGQPPPSPPPSTEGPP